MKKVNPYEGTWPDIRWNEAIKLFNKLIEPIIDDNERDYLSLTVPCVSHRLAIHKFMKRMY